jgi:hypothetical protein
MPYIEMAVPMRVTPIPHRWTGSSSTIPSSARGSPLPAIRYAVWMKSFRGMKLRSATPVWVPTRNMPTPAKPMMDPKKNSQYP